MVETFKFIHLASIVVWVGSIVFFSFFAAPSIFRSLSREEAGKLVGLIFPKYYMVGYVSGFLSITTLFYLGNMDGSILPETRLAILVFMAIVTLYSGIFVGGKARRIKAEIQELKDSTEENNKEKLGGLRKEFGKTHRVSMILNVTVFLSSLVLVYLTAQSLTFG